MMQKTTFLFLGIILLLSGTDLVSAAPEPGDVFREYYWYNRSGDADMALRVGGDMGYDGGNVDLGHVFDLQHAVKAELIIEKIQSHPDTKNLEISLNDNEWISVPIPETIPSPQTLYLHHIYPVMEIPLSWLHDSEGNGFKMRVSPAQKWNWPQNLINGVHVRIYYDPAEKSHPTGEIVAPASDSSIGESATFRADAESPDGDIKQVDFIGLYEDVNYEGDGVYYQWHYHYYHGFIRHHIGTAKISPYEVTWDTSWIPDQELPMQAAARIIDETGMIFMTEPVTGLALDRGTVSVELCKPYNVPIEWSTRNAGRVESFDITGNPGNAIAAQLVWTSWCPGYMNGISINGVKIFDKEGPYYKYYFHRVSVDSLAVFSRGTNYLRTGQLQKINDVDIHGMEVQWPGIMVLVKYENDAAAIESETTGQPAFELHGNYPNPFNMSTAIRYTLHESATVECRIHSLTGQVVKILASSYQEAGSRDIMWDGTNDNGTAVSSGLYVFTLSANGRTSARKLLFMK